MDTIQMGQITVYPFGLALTAGLLGCAVWIWKTVSGDRERKTMDCFWLIALPLGLILARLVYALCSLDMIEDEFFEVLTELPGSGFMFYGALAGSVFALVIACRWQKVSFARCADLLAGPFLLFGGACALGEGLSGGGYGWKVEDWFTAENGMSLFETENPEGLVSFFGHFPFAVTDSYYGYASWAVFLPVAVFLLAALLFLCRIPMEKSGNRAVFSLSLYAAVRILYESLRQDDIPKWGFVRVSQLLSGILLVLILAGFTRRLLKAGRPFPVLPWVGTAACMGLILAMEFALEKKILFLQWMRMDLCYLVMAAASAGLTLIGVRQWKRFSQAAEGAAPRNASPKLPQEFP